MSTSLYGKIRESIGDLIDKGGHLNVAKSTQYIAKKFGLSDRMINYTHIEMRNMLNEPKYKRTPYNERVLFLPQCLRNSSKCKAVMGDEGWECRNCGACVVCEIRKMADELGYKKVVIAPGGSMVHKVIVKYKPKAVLGVGCFEEVNMAFDKIKGTNVAPQGVILLNEGCKDTMANMDEIREKMELIDEKLAK